MSPQVVEPNLGSGPLNPSEFASGGGMLAVLNLKLGAEAYRHANLLSNGARRYFLHVHGYAHHPNTARTLTCGRAGAGTQFWFKPDPPQASSLRNSSYSGVRLRLALSLYQTILVRRSS